MGVKFSADRQLRLYISKTRYLTVCTGQYGRRSPPQELILEYKSGMPEHSRDQTGYRPVSIDPVRLCDQLKC